MTEFKAFPKIGRLSKGCMITEKIDGTNAQIVISAGEIVKVGSRRRWITPDNDNFGFATWVSQNAEALKVLGEGVHYGEWYGLGIQRGYGLPEKRLALFNPQRHDPEDLPDRVDVVPILYQGEFTIEAIGLAMVSLYRDGSHLAPGFINPEGIVIGTAAGLFKETYEYKEGKWKGKAA